jgi:hypothetical protein
MHGEMARYRVRDLIHQAEAERMARAARSARRAGATGGRWPLRRVGAAALGFMLWPFRH